MQSVVTRYVWTRLVEKLAVKTVPATSRAGKCEYDRWVVETQLCKLRDTSDMLIGRACALFVFVIRLWCLWSTSIMVGDTQFHKFHGRPFARVLDVFIMKDLGRWLPWVLQGSNRTILQRCCLDHSAHGYYITRVAGGVRYAWYCYILKQNKTILIWSWKKCSILSCQVAFFGFSLFFYFGSFIFLGRRVCYAVVPGTLALFLFFLVAYVRTLFDSYFVVLFFSPDRLFTEFVSFRKTIETETAVY